MSSTSISKCNGESFPFAVVDTSLEDDIARCGGLEGDEEMLYISAMIVHIKLSNVTVPAIVIA
jgi:hypothetical protein